MQAVVWHRQLIVFSCVTLGSAAVAVAQSRSGAVLMARRQHTGSWNAQSAERILTGDARPCRFGCRSVLRWRSAITCQQHAGSRIAQAADRILTRDA